MGRDLTEDGDLHQSLFVGSVMPELTALQKCMSFPVSFCNTAETVTAIILRSVE